ncbi:hypothetical protein BC937DRAFT_92945, partial [Endogone sp. FLAS-F59071]
LENFKQLAEGGFAKVFRAQINISSEVHDVAAKELPHTMISELVLNVYLSRSVQSVNNAPTMEVIGLSQHPDTGLYLMIMQFADMGTLENRPCDCDGDW